MYDSSEIISGQTNKECRPVMAGIQFLGFFNVSSELVHYEILVAKITVFPKSQTLSYNYFSPSYAKLLILEIKLCHVGSLLDVVRAKERTVVIEEGISRGTSP